MSEHPWMPTPAELVINDPAGLDMEIDRLCRLLDAAGLELGSLVSQLGGTTTEPGVELQFEDAFIDEITSIIEDHEKEGRKLPGEDARRALALGVPRIRVLYHEKRRIERRIEAIEKWSRKVENSLSARQSQMSRLKAEWEAQRYGRGERGSA